MINGVPSDLILCDTNLHQFGGQDVLMATSKVRHDWAAGEWFRISFDVEPYVTFEGMLALLEKGRRVTDHLGRTEYRYNFAGDLNVAVPVPKEKPKRPPLDRWKLVN